LKKVLKIILVIVVLVLIVAVGVVIWQWDSISIFMNNAKVEGALSLAPEPTVSVLPPLTKGETDWFGWRGVNDDGRSLVKGISLDWSSGLQKSWEIDYLCQGGENATWSAPVLQGNRLVVCGRDSASDIVFCLNPDTGDLIWKSSYPAEALASYGAGSRATPRIEENRVYTFGRSGDLVCWNLFDGSKLWHTNVHDLGGEEHTWGHSSSPLIIDSLVVVNGGGTARTIAFDKKTGDVIWKSGSGLAGYAAISSLSIENKTVLLTFHGKGLAALDPADGKELWNTFWETNYDVNATTPVHIEDKIYITSGYKTGGELLKASLSDVEVLWKNKSIASQHSDPFIIDGYIYGYSGDSMQNKGDFKCVDLNTGEEKWSTNKMGWGTCVYVEGYLLCCDIKGNLFLMQPNPNKFTLITRFPKALGKVSGAAWTVPVLANGKLYLRFKQKLICYEILS